MKIRIISKIHVQELNIENEEELIKVKQDILNTIQSKNGIYILKTESGEELIMSKAYLENSVIEIIS